jgi:RHS repeat-associated protein
LASGVYGALSYSYAANSNQLTSVVNGETRRSLAFTAAGNLASDNNGGGTVLSFSYNQQNRLAQVANQNTALAAFQQNFLGERVVKSTSAGVFDFHYDEAGHLIAESDGASGAVRNEYTWLDDMPVAMVSAGTLYFIHPYHLGTPRRITDGSQNIVWDAALRPFGEVEQLTQTFTLNLRFPGQYADAETGLNYNFFRDYDPSVGRYVESDPIGLEGRNNTYYKGHNWWWFPPYLPSPFVVRNPAQSQGVTKWVCLAEAKMQSFKLGTTIAHRQLSLSDGGKITVRVGKPQRSPDRRSYFCPYQIVGLGHDHVRRAPGGLDSIHALQFALEKVGIDLHVLNEAYGGAIRWDGDTDGDLGFPLQEKIKAILKK